MKTQTQIHNPVELVYHEYGKGILLVLLHGYPLDYTIWEKIVPSLEKRARVILPDLRGHGASPEMGDRVSIREMAEDVYALYERLQSGRMILGGHSMGGYIALAYAHAYPQHLNGLALIATQSEADTPERRQGRLITAREVRRRGVGYIAKGMPSKLTDNPDIQHQIQEIIEKTRQNTLIQSQKAMADRPDASLWLANITVPSLVIAGKQDHLIPVEQSASMVQLLNKGWLVELPTAGHLPMIEDPEGVVEALEQLICAAAGCE
jgi:3-oxoadipate enol-lactonase